MRDIDKIQRQVHFMAAQTLVFNGAQPKNNTWVYNRAPEGYKFLLSSIVVSAPKKTATLGVLGEGIIGLFDGHEYTRWNIFPGVESREYLARFEITDPMLNDTRNLHNWECKEYSLAIRSNSTVNAFKTMIIIWYYLVKMSYLETLYYAVIQPRWKRFKKAFRTTVEVGENE